MRMNVQKNYPMYVVSSELVKRIEVLVSVLKSVLEE
jgi:hypothetical protein